VVHVRANAFRRFTDVPLVMWYETDTTTHGTRLRYSVVFSNEDGGTPADRLMATWGRTTDIEFVYGVEIDGGGRLVAEEFQGPGHEVPSFKGRHEASHPLLWTVTDNNMVSDAGTTSIRYAPAPEHVELENVSREVVMDRHPWSYAVMAGEMIRETKIADDATAGSGKIPDVRRFVFVEACAELENAALAFSIRSRSGSGKGNFQADPRAEQARPLRPWRIEEARPLRRSDAPKLWYDSDRGRPDFRIVRSGCFRGAVPLPSGAGPPDAIRFRAFSRPPENAAPPPTAGSVRVTRINQVFTLGATFLPKPSVFRWTGSLPLTLDGEWRELAFEEPVP